MSNFERLGISIDKRVADALERSWPKSSARNKSEFVEEAIEYYIAALNAKDTSRVLSPALQSVIRSSISMSEDRIAKVLYKQGVELAMLMHIIAATYDFDPSTLDNLRKTCTQEVSRLSGKYKFDDAVAYEARNS